MSKHDKHKILLAWLAKFETQAHGRDCLAKLEHSYGEKLGIETLTIKQLDLVTKIASMGYSFGCAETRDWFAAHRESQTKSDLGTGRVAPVLRLVRS